MLSVGDRTVEQIMTPRTEVEFLSADTPVEEAQLEVSRLEHSRYPVRQGSSDDDVLGFIHIRDLIRPAPHVRRVGDLVRIMETRPLSATKHFRVVEIIEKAK